VTIRLAEPESRALEGFCRRQLKWDAGLPARVVTTPRALGVFTAPPLGVLVFVAVPTASVVSAGDAVDTIVPLSALANCLRDRARDGMDIGSLPRAIVPVGTSPTLQHLPPTEGWQLPIFGVSGDLVPTVDEATAEFEARSVGLPPRAQETVAEEIWDRHGFGGLPLRALHAARQLGMITTDRAKVSAATCGPWKRFSTPRGQVFVYSSGPAARLALHVVR
jgi:hypothetical protein